MTETRKRSRKTESVEGPDEQIAERESELAEGYGRPLTWEEITSTTAEEMAAKEQRRGILPRLIHAAKVRRLELEKKRREESPDKREELWQESVRAYNARGREENWAAWCEYHQEQAERHRAVERHQDRCYHEPQLRGG